jgi:hypothetical protein
MQDCALKIPLLKRLFQYRFGESAMTHPVGLNGSSQSDVRFVLRKSSDQGRRVGVGVDSLNSTQPSTQDRHEPRK